MDYWPAEKVDRAKLEKATKRRARTKGEETADESRPYPLVEQGAVTAASLGRNGRRLEWNFISQNDSGRRLRAQGTSTKIFPATYPKMPDTPNVSIMRRAEHGAHFLRTHYPDVDLASDLIREELAEDARRAATLEALDPHYGNKLAFIALPERTRKKTACLIFPMGPTGRDLNVSQLTYSKRDHVTFKPSAACCHSFETPIDQIVAQTEDVADPANGTYLAVRLIGSTKILNLQWQGGSSGEPAVHTVASFSRSAVGERHIVDVTPPVAHGTKHMSILAVTDAGYVYSCSTDARASSSLVHMPALEAADDNFWRIAPMADQETALLLCRKSLHLLDMRSPSTALQLLSRARDTFTALEGPLYDRMIRVTTGEELLWIDERFPQKPVLSYRHGRQRDCTLTAKTITVSNDPFTFLLSSKNNLVTVYDVSNAQTGSIQMSTPAYTLQYNDPQECTSAGHVLLRHPSDTDNTGVILVRLSQRGSMHRLDLRLDEGDSSHVHTGQTHIWSDDVHELDKGVYTAPASQGSLGERTFSENDLDPAYRRVFALDDATSADEGESVYDTLDSMKTFWGTSEVPLENMLTTFDVAFRSGGEPHEPTRADFFTGSALSSTRGYRALIQGRIPYQDVAKKATWHHNNRLTLKKFVPSIAKNPADTFEQLGSFATKMDDYRTGPSMRWETRAREQVALDLALSSDVYSPHPIKRKGSSESHHSIEDDAFETMSRAAEAMSIGVSEPPPVQFGFLRPVSKANDYYAENKQEHDSRGEYPLGVRLLLQEWDVGSDPATYVWTDPYDTAGASIPMLAAPFGSMFAPELPPAPTQQSQRAPPVIVPAARVAPPAVASSLPARAPLPIVQARSLGDLVTARPAPSMASQPESLQALQDEYQAPMMPSTQVLPGPFGGRPPAAKKKVVKKRLGGF